MKKLYLLLFFLTLQVAVQAQDGCGTPPPERALFEYLEQIGESYRSRGQQRVSNTEILNVPLYMHIVTSNSGSKYNFNTMLTVICELNDKFLSAGIRFYLDGVNYINDPSLYDHTSFQTGSQMMVQYNQARKVNVYFVNLGLIGLCGYAFFPGTGPGTTLRNGGLMMSVGCSQVGNTTLAHEMGHYLALPHPFDGTSNHPSSPISERITRSATDTVGGRLPANCSWAGDRFCDTRADFIGTRWSCAGNPPTQLDVNGDLFDPDETLFMSYSNDNCQNRFSEEQINTMRHTLVGDSTTQGSRAYLMITPMAPFSVISTNSVPIEPNNPNTVVNSDYMFFKWTAAPGATQYLFRILRNNQIVEEVVISDTAYFLPVFRMSSGAAHTWNVRPFNHAYTCMPPSASGSFRAGTNFGTSVRQLESEKIAIFPTLIDAGQPLYVDVADLEAENLQLDIFDLQGRLVKSETLTGQSRHSFILDDLGRGLYQIRISGNGLLKNSRVFKQ